MEDLLQHFNRQLTIPPAPSEAPFRSSRELIQPIKKKIPFHIGRIGFIGHGHLVAIHHLMNNENSCVMPVIVGKEKYEEPKMDRVKVHAIPQEDFILRSSSIFLDDSKKQKHHLKNTIEKRRRKK